MSTNLDNKIFHFSSYSTEQLIVVITTLSLFLFLSGGTAVQPEGVSAGKQRVLGLGRGFGQKMEAVLLEREMPGHFQSTTEVTLSKVQTPKCSNRSLQRAGNSSMGVSCLHVQVE